MRLVTWLNVFGRRFRRFAVRAAGKRRLRHESSCSSQVQSLENRTLLAAVSWDGDAGDFQWSNPLNWGTDVLPGANDDVVIDLGTNNFTVIHSAGTDSVKSLTSHAGLNVSGGELLVTEDSELRSDLLVSGIFGGSGDIVVSGAFVWDGGTLRGANGGGSLTANGGTSVTNFTRRSWL